jgi:hypothetical protein
MANETHIRIDGKWELEDFGVFSKHYTQCYALLYSLHQANVGSPIVQNFLDFEYSKFPWRGGYSVLHFYYALYHHIPFDDRPKVKRIAYSSPGGIDLEALLAVSLRIGNIVQLVGFGAFGLNELYSRITKGMNERKLGRLEIEAKEFQIGKEQLEFAIDSLEKLSKALGVSPEEMAVLERRTKGNKLVQLKVLMSLYRRVTPLAELALREMLFLESDDSGKDGKEATLPGDSGEPELGEFS